MRAEAELFFPEVRYADSTFKNGRAKATGEGGVIRLTELEGELDGKPVKGSGSVDFNSPKPTFQVEAECAGVPVKQAFLSTLAYPLPFLASKEGHLLHLTSRVDGKISLKGEGIEWTDLQKNLAGEGRLALGAGSLAGPAALGLLMAGRGGALSFDSVDAPFQIAEGKVKTPGIVLKAGETSLSLVGTTGLDGALDYSVQVALPQRLREEGWGKRLEGLFGKQGLPVGLGGTVRDPKPTFKMPELKEAGKALLEGAIEKLKKKKKE